MNPYDLIGPQFLVLYLAVLAMTVALAVAVRDLIESQSYSDSVRGAQLDQYEFAMLAGGKEAVFSTAITALSHDGVLALSDKAGYIERVNNQRQVRHPFEEAVLNRVSETPKSVYSVYTSMATNLERIAERLGNFGLLTSNLQLTNARFIPALIVFSPILFLAVPKTLIGIARDKPVGFLFFLSLVQAVIALVFLLRARKSTDAGKVLLERARQANAALSYNYRSSPKSLSSKDLALGAALFGSASLLPDVYSQVRHSLRPPASSGSVGGSSCGGGSCGGGGCGGGCGGCGGCGG